MCLLLDLLPSHSLLAQIISAPSQRPKLVRAREALKQIPNELCLLALWPNTKLLARHVSISGYGGDRNALHFTERSVGRPATGKLARAAKNVRAVRVCVCG